MNRLVDFASSCCTALSGVLLALVVASSCSVAMADQNVSTLACGACFCGSPPDANDSCHTGACTPSCYCLGTTCR